MNDVSRKIVEMIVRRCKLYDVDIEKYDFDGPIFYSDETDIEDGLELDSVDALEIVAGIKEEFGIIMEADDNSVFYSINTLTKFVESKIKERE